MLSPNGQNKKGIPSPYSAMKLLAEAASGALQSKLHLRVGSPVSSDQVAQGLFISVLRTPKNGDFVTFQGPAPSDPSSSARAALSTPTAARQIQPSFQLLCPSFQFPALLQLPAVPVDFPSFPQNPAAAAAYL